LHHLRERAVPSRALNMDPLHGVFDWFRIKGVPPFFRPCQIRDFGLTPAHLTALIRRGAVERVCRGVYHLVSAGRGQNYLLAVACARSSGSMVCLHSALRVHGIKSQAPPAVWLAIPYRSRAPRLRGIPVRIVRFKPIAWTFRVTEIDIDGVPTYITSPARTVADCFRLARQAGTEAGMEAFCDALGKRLVTIEELSRIEHALPCLRLRALLARYADGLAG
jgi:predicted transcriptional regulator of viral defense system